MLRSSRTVPARETLVRYPEQLLPVYFKHAKACKLVAHEPAPKGRLRIERLRQDARRFDIRICIAPPHVERRVRIRHL